MEPCLAHGLSAMPMRPLGRVSLSILIMMSELLMRDLIISLWIQGVVCCNSTSQPSLGKITIKTAFSHGRRQTNGRDAENFLGRKIGYQQGVCTQNLLYALFILNRGTGNNCTISAHLSSATRHSIAECGTFSAVARPETGVVISS